MFKDLSKKNTSDLLIYDFDKRDKYRHCYFKCKTCNGTGLKGYKLMEHGSYSWNGEFCDKCDGLGLLDFNELLRNGYNIKDFYIDEKMEEE